MSAIDRARDLERRDNDPDALVRFVIERERAGQPLAPKTVEVLVYILPLRKRRPVAYALRSHNASWWLDPLYKPKRAGKRRRATELAPGVTARHRWWTASLKLGALGDVSETLKKLRFVRWERVA